MYVIGIFAERDVCKVGNIGVRFIFGGSDACGVAVNLPFLKGFFREVARYEIIGFSAVHQV